ncbi:DUF2357 domain-containing protein [Actinomadura sp. 3N508]|uniref:DUF2357 domain-containing protein n=1 Tax=Actinomadura sp. 3N508 TaxID=3375153 RepID=UPI00379BA7CE
MSEGPPLWDRVTGAVVPLPSSPVLLGRYQVPLDEHGYSLGNRTLRPGDYLASGGTRWTLRSAGARWTTGDFGTAPIPAPITVESVTAVAGELSGLERDGKPLAEWMAVLPMVDGVEERLTPHPLEDRLRVEFGHLRKVCHDPHARLRTEHVLVPVSQARRITWRTVTYLAGHSETWATRRLRGVEPARLLTPVQAADHDLYENRVVATLVERLWEHVLTRLAEIESIEEMVGRAPDLLDEVEKRKHWRERKRLYEMIGRLVEDDGLPERIQAVHGKLAHLRDALAPLLDSELRKGVRGRYAGPPRLRPTNLWDNHPDYRHCRSLWDAEVAARQGGDGTEKSAEAVAAWCEDFASYVLLLVLRALELFGLDAARSSAPAPVAGRPGARFQYRGHLAGLDRSPDDTFALLLDERPVLRVVPLPHALTSAAGQVPFDRIAAGLGVPDGAAVIVVYPGEIAERKDLPVGARLASHEARGRGTTPGMVPVSPSDLGSIGRVARALRAALDGQIMRGYPVRIATRISGTREWADRFDWIEWRPGELLVTRPAAHPEVQKMRASLADLRTRTDKARHQGDNRDELKALEAGLLAAVQTVRSLTTCPVCLREAPDPVRAFSRWKDETYRCTCHHCGTTTWELRRCPKCNDRYPVLTVSGLSERTGGDGDHLDRLFSRDLLAPPCWVRDSSYLCWSCGHCPEVRSESAPEACTRCNLQSP